MGPLVGRFSSGKTIGALAAGAESLFDQIPGINCSGGEQGDSFKILHNDKFSIVLMIASAEPIHRTVLVETTERYQDSPT